MFSYTISVVLLFTSIAAVATSQLLLKWRLGGMQGMTGPDGAPLPRMKMLAAVLPDPWVWLGGALIVAGAVMWYAALTRLPLSFMMPAAALIAPITALSAWLLLGERLTPGQAAAIAVIAAGVAWLSAQQ